MPAIPPVAVSPPATSIASPAASAGAGATARIDAGAQARPGAGPETAVARTGAAPRGTPWEFLPPTTELGRGMRDAWMAADAVEQVGIEMNAGNGARATTLASHTNALTDSLVGVARIATSDGKPEIADLVLQASQATSMLAAHSVTAYPTMPLDQQVHVVDGIAHIVPRVKDLLQHTPEALLEQLRGGPVSSDDAVPTASTDAASGAPAPAPDPEAGPAATTTPPAEPAATTTPPALDEAGAATERPAGNTGIAGGVPGASPVPGAEPDAAPLSLEAPMDPDAPPIGQVRAFEPALQAALLETLRSRLQ